MSVGFADTDGKTPEGNFRCFLCGNAAGSADGRCCGKCMRSAVEDVGRYGGCWPGRAGMGGCLRLMAEKPGMKDWRRKVRWIPGIGFLPEG